MWGRDKKELDAECGRNPNPLASSIQEMMARDKRLPQPFFSLQQCVNPTKVEFNIEKMAHKKSKFL